MLFLTLAKQPHENYLLYFFVWQHKTEMTHTAELRTCLLLHALKMVIIIAMKTEKGILSSMNLFLTQTHSPLEKIID